MGLFDLFSNDTAEEAARQRNAGLQKGYDALSSTYGQGRDALTTGYGKAGDLYNNLLTSNTAGAGAYGDAAGANGAAGYDRARTNFQTNPGYQFQMDQGQQALNRSHAAAGNLNSGNADADTLKFSQGLANQSYGGYMAGLQPYLGGQQQATAGAANAAAGLGTGLNQSFEGQGNAANANYTGQGASDAAATMNNYNVGANQLGALLGVGNLISGGAGGGLTSGLGGLFSSFGGGGGLSGGKAFNNSPSSSYYGPLN